MRFRLLITFLLLVAACSSAPPAGDHDTGALNAARKKASVQLEAGAYDAALQTLEPLSRATPRDEQVWVMLGDAQRGLGQFDPAVKSYEQAIRINYGDYVPHLKLGTWLMENGKTGRALTEFEVAVEYGNDDPLTHYNYGLALREMGRPDEALTQWRVARDLAPGNPEVVEAVGIGLSGIDDKAAVECFEQAEELGRGGASFSNNFALALERTGQQQRAREYFAAAVAADSSREEYARNLALHDMRVADYARAEPELQSLVARFGARWSYCAYLARARVELGRFDAALDALQPFRAELDAGKLPPAGERIDRVPPTLAEALSSEGLAWRGRKDPARARAALERAAALAPRDPSILINYGVVLAESGMLAEARAQWKRVLELDPGNTTARANLSAYER